MLKQRILTALILAPLVISAVLYLPSDYFALLAGALILLGGLEWGHLASLTRCGQRLMWFQLPLLALLFAAHHFGLGHILIYAALAWWLLALLAVLRYPQGSGLWHGTPARLLAGWLILAPAWVGLVGMHREFGPGYVLLLLLMIWAADSGAYFAGRAFGRHKLAPRVSPGKSWEGVIGGLLAALTVAVVAAQWLVYPGGLAAFLPLAVLVIFVSVLGDLTESLFKRMADIKDSGSLLPGHGGILDRIDSLTAAAPVLLAGLYLLEAWQ